MFIERLIADPLFFVVSLVAIVIALTIHEFAHALMANRFGDGTAKAMGRLSLNPLAHLDVVGFLAMLFIGFGWAKPVPVNPYNLRRPKLASALIAFFGPLSNLILAAIALVAFKIILPYLGPENLLIGFLSILVLINLVLAVFNLIPLPPLDGSQILFNLLPARFDDFKNRLMASGPWILICLLLADSFLGLGILNAFFNLVLSFLFWLM